MPGVANHSRLTSQSILNIRKAVDAIRNGEYVAVYAVRIKTVRDRPHRRGRSGAVSPPDL
jgi:hypothetical protein